jgi:hypothetical protein
MTRRPNILTRLPLIALLLGGPLLATAPAAEGADAATSRDEGLQLFESTVRPVLLDHCIKCHGDDKPKSNLQLTSRSSLLKGGSRGPAAVPGDPAASLIVRALRHEGELKMPRDGARLVEQLPAFERWVALGLPWPEGGGAVLSPPVVAPGAGWTITDAQRAHWSFQPVRATSPPAVDGASPATTDLDRFILAKLAAGGVKPVGPADRHTLLRRATFDLTGLPPTPEEVDAFVNDPAADAFARVVERLLASPAYGERWGRHWLDVARYADTAGETADFPVRDAYRYRDYVIASFNADKPYDRFIHEQVAGDLLAKAEPPERYAQNVTATGFLALSRRFGYDSENYHHLTIQDTLDTLGQAVLGLSLGCARCHDHKYDPVSAADYYALYGIFESTRYPFPGSEQKQKTRAMSPLLPPAEARAAQSAFEQKLAGLEGALAGLKAPYPRVTVASVEEADGAFEMQARSNGGSLGVLVPPWVYAGTPEVTPNAQSAYRTVYARVHRFDIPVGTVGVKFPAGDGAHSIRQSLRPARTAATHDRVWVNLDFRNMTPGAGAWRVTLGHGAGDSPAVEVFVTGDALSVRNGATVETVTALRQGEWYNLQIEIDLDAGTFSGAVATPAEAGRFTGKALAGGWDGTIDHVLIDGAGHVPGARPEHDVDNFAISDVPLPSLSAPAESPGAPVAAAAPAVAGQATEPAPAAAGAGDAESLARQLRELVDRGPCDMAYAVAEGTPTDSRVQLRGEPGKPGDVVPRRFLTVLGGDALPPDAARSSSGRLQLAQWLTRPQNPLTARVMVNRIWQHHFGAGLVPTENDFGLRGQPPTHPELLDWLAGKFVESGWSVKSMHRLILLSEAYQRSGDVEPAALAADPGNALLWRFGRRRLEAEALRDAMLAVSGALDRTTPGPHPFPSPQDWGFTQHGPFAAVYETDRRSVYLMTQRLKRHPFLGLFDGADANASTARRPVTTVPTQALFMMNSPFVHAQATRFAARVTTPTADVPARVALAYKLALAREPSAEEIDRSTEFLEQYRQQLAAARVPAGEIDAQAWAAFARTLLVSNEFVYVD